MKKFLFLVFFAASVNSIHAADNIRFFWSFGNISVNFEGTDEKMRFFSSFSAGNISWITSNGIGWGFHIFDIEAGTKGGYALILPVELSYSPFGDNSSRLFLTLYGRGGWRLFNYAPDTAGNLWDKSSLFGAVGLRAAWIPNAGEYWSIFTGAFIEYTSRNEIRLGVSIDTSVLVVLTAIAFGIALDDDDDEY